VNLSDLKTNAAIVEQGDWVDNIPDMGDLRLKVRGRGNSRWRALEAQLVAAVPRGKRINGRIPPADVDRIAAICVRDAGLLDWENLKDGDQAVLYSKDMANTLLTDPQYRAFFDAAVWACSVVGDATVGSQEADQKN
jgi:hypothetical protein